MFFFNNKIFPFDHKVNKMNTYFFLQSILPKKALLVP